MAVVPCGVAPSTRGSAAPRRTIPPCIAPPHPGTRDCSTFAKLGFLSEPAHATPNPQENSCRQPKTMLIKYEAKFPYPSNPSGYWIADSPLARFLEYWPKTAQARGPTPGNRAYQTCSHTPNRPQPHLPTPGSATTRGCIGSKLGFHSCLPQIRRVITAQKPNTMLIKSATHTPNKSPHPLQGNEDQNFKGKRLPKPQKAAKLVARRTPSPHPASARPQPNPRTTTALLRRPRTGYPTMGARSVGWESGGRQACDRSATCPGFG